MNNKRGLASIFAVLVVALLLKPAFGRAEDLCDIARSGISEASNIRGLKIKHKVPCLVQDRDQIRGFLLHTIDTKMPPDKIAMEELVYKTLGLIPEKFPYKQGMVELYVSQIGGYYDPDKQHFVMASWMPAIMQTTIAVHELTHALQDQYFNLKDFVDMKSGSGDLLMARSALVEGDATAVMIDYPKKLMGQPALADEDNVEGIMMQNLLSTSFISGLGDVPESLKAMLIFPYTSGLRFVHFLLRKGGYEEVNKAFRNPPKSTEEILHPEKYLAGEHGFKNPADGELQPEGSKVIYSDVLGEFGIAALLSMYQPDKGLAAKAASGWGGDKVIVVEDQAKRRALIWKTLWDTEQDAEEFYEVFSSGVKQRSSGESMPELKKDKLGITFIFSYPSS